MNGITEQAEAEDVVMVQARLGSKMGLTVTTTLQDEGSGEFRAAR